ncbi:MAG TPA: hypothetical protein VFA29_02585, partial [Candidatus Baltobacteraceae bacterium]|nr:hypothetical protein [Candidatus Baltobacteraceae bacterium]
MQPERRFPRRNFGPRPNPGIIRAQYAGVFDLNREGYEAARSAALEWVRTNETVLDRIGRIEGDEFDVSRDGVVVQCTRTADDTTTVLRLQHPDYNKFTRVYDRVRDWRTDITIGRDEKGAWLATRQWYKGVASDIKECYPPKFIKSLWISGALADDLVLQERCWLVEYGDELDELVRLINDEERAMPVVVMAEGCPLDPQRVAHESIGLAHV